MEESRFSGRMSLLKILSHDLHAKSFYCTSRTEMQMLNTHHLVWCQEEPLTATTAVGAVTCWRTLIRWIYGGAERVSLLASLAWLVDLRPQICFHQISSQCCLNITIQEKNLSLILLHKLHGC